MSAYASASRPVGYTFCRIVRISHYHIRYIPLLHTKTIIRAVRIDVRKWVCLHVVSIEYYGIIFDDTADALVYSTGKTYIWVVETSGSCPNLNKNSGTSGSNAGRRTMFAVILDIIKLNIMVSSLQNMSELAFNVLTAQISEMKCQYLTNERSYISNKK